MKIAKQYITTRCKMFYVLNIRLQYMFYLFVQKGCIIYLKYDFLCKLAIYIFSFLQRFNLP